MIVEYIRYKNDPSETAAFIAAYTRAAQSLRDSQNCLGYELTHCAEEAGAFILRIVWDSADGHLKGFRTSPEFKVFFVAIQPYIKNIQEMRHYEVTDLQWSRT
jgi:quinol monooxygenase YgiN